MKNAEIKNENVLKVSVESNALDVGPRYFVGLFARAMQTKTEMESADREAQGAGFEQGALGRRRGSHGRERRATDSCVFRGCLEPKRLF